MLGTIGSSEIFGEMGFVQCQPASASVVAESDEVELYVIEGYYLGRLMQVRSTHPACTCTVLTK